MLEIGAAAQEVAGPSKSISLNGEMELTMHEPRSAMSKSEKQGRLGAADAAERSRNTDDRTNCADAILAQVGPKMETAARNRPQLRRDASVRSPRVEPQRDRPAGT